MFGERMYAREFMGGLANAFVDRFRRSLEVRVKALFLELIKD